MPIESLLALAAATLDPNTYEEAMKCENNVWYEPMSNEMKELFANNTMILVKRPENGKTVLKCKWVYKTKLNTAGEEDRKKARLTAKGFNQKYGIDFFHTFAPVMKYASLRMILSIACIRDWELESIDVKNAFTHADLQEEIYMEQPKGFVVPGKEDWVYKLNKSLYGLKQAPYEWYNHMTSTLLELGFIKCASDPCVFHYNTTTKSKIIIGLFVDDIAITFSNNDRNEWESLKSKIKDKYKIKDIGTCDSILQMRITRDRPQKLLWLDQQAYIEKISERFDYIDVRKMDCPGTSMELLSINKELPVVSEIKQKEFQAKNGALLYASLSTRPDIAHSVNTVCRFNKEAQEQHFVAQDKIFRYLANTKHLKLCMDGNNTNSDNTDSTPVLTAYSDADYAGNHDTRKSTTGVLIKLNNCVINWLSRTQKTVAKSSCQSELMALGDCTAELLWIRNFLIELGVIDKDQVPAVIKCDNRSTVHIASEDLANTKTKHIAVNYHFIKEAIDSKQIAVKWVSGDEQLADCLTKPLTKILFNKFVNTVMGEC
jgi:Reverse transcriptase (RNA-dependent DNA polymerase)